MPIVVDNGETWVQVEYKMNYFDVNSPTFNEEEFIRDNREEICKSADEQFERMRKFKKD